MPGESPLHMMQQRTPLRRSAPAAPRRRRIWPFWVSAVIVVALAAGWSGLWYYAAKVANRTLSGWVDRETAAGRSYSCGAQSMSGFPFRIEASCDAAGAKINSSHPPFSVSAKGVTFTTQVYHPTLLVGHITGPLAVAESDQPASFVANWSRAQISVRGLPPDPDGFTVTLDGPRVDHIDGANTTTIFQAQSANLDSRIIGGSAGNNPVIHAQLRFAAASMPTLHPLLAEPIAGEMDVVLQGFKDLAPKRWSERFREMQAAGGTIEIKSFRIDRSDAAVVGTGTLTVNEHGRLEGLVRVAIVGIEHIVPLLGVDKAIGKGIDRLSGASGQSAQGLSALDRLMPGLSDVVRDTANASLIDNIKKMGQPIELDHKPAIVLPLRFSDGSMYLGMLPLGDVPPLF